MPAFYVISTCDNRYYLANNKQAYSASIIHHGNKPKYIKQFKYLGAAKTAAAKVTDKYPWIDFVVIKVEANEFLRPDGGVTRISDSGELIDTGRGRIVAKVAKSS